MTAQPREWDRHAINAEVRRRGLNLTDIARDAGLYESACRQGIIGKSRPGAEAIATALGIPFRTLFAPPLYTRGQHREDDRNSNARCKTSAKARPRPDRIQAAE
jgi:Ner family transcriptional regulator